MNRIFIILITFFFDCAMSFFWLGISYWLIDIGGTQAQLGLLTSCVYGIQIPVFYFLDRIIKVFNKFVLLCIGLLLVVLFTLYCSFAKNIPFLFVIACLVTIGHAVFYTVFGSIMSQYSNSEKASGDSICFNIGWCGGSCLCAIISPIIVRNFQNRPIGLKSLGISCAIFGLFCLVTIILNYFDLKKKNITNFKEENKYEKIKNNDIYLNSARWTSLVGGFASATFLFIFPKIFTDIGWESYKIVRLSGMSFNGVALGTILCLFTGFWKSNMWTNLFGIIIFFITSISCLYFRDYYILMCAFVFLCGIASGIVGNSGLYHTMCSDEDKRDKNFAILMGINSVASVVSGLLGALGGHLFDLYNLEWLRNLNLYIINAFSIFVLILFIFYFRKLKSK